MRYLMLMLVIMTGCATSGKLSTEAKALERMKAMDEETQNSIHILIHMVKQQALITDPSAKQYVPYEFYIPIDNRKKRQIYRIDPSVTFTKRRDAYLCIGENASKEKIFCVVALPYTYKVRFCPFE